MQRAFQVPEQLALGRRPARSEQLYLRAGRNLEGESPRDSSPVRELCNVIVNGAIKAAKPERVEAVDHSERIRPRNLVVIPSHEHRVVAIEQVGIEKA